MLLIGGRDFIWCRKRWKYRNYRILFDTGNRDSNYHLTKSIISSFKTSSKNINKVIFHFAPKIKDISRLDEILIKAAIWANKYVINFIFEIAGPKKVDKIVEICLNNDYDKLAEDMIKLCKNKEILAYYHVKNGKLIDEQVNIWKLIN
jgi:hypothetical protein